MFIFQLKVCKVVLQLLIKYTTLKRTTRIVKKVSQNTEENIQRNSGVNRFLKHFQQSHNLLSTATLSHYFCEKVFGNC